MVCLSIALALLIPLTSFPGHAVFAASRSAIVRPSPALDENDSTACGLYLIALDESTLAGLGPGETLDDILSGDQPGNFGWLSWSGDPSAVTLANSLTAPGDSHAYVNPTNPSDPALSVGDYVSGSPGITNSRDVRTALDTLLGSTISIPVWDESRKKGRNTLYRVAGFADIEIVDYRLPGENRITAVFHGLIACGEIPGNDPPVAVDDEAGIGDRFRLRIEWLDQGDPARMCRVYLECIAGIVAIQSEWRDQQSPIDADRVHRCHHVVAGDLIRTLQESAPRTLRTIPLVGMYL